MLVMFYAGGASGALLFPYLMNINSKAGGLGSKTGGGYLLAEGMTRSMYACSAIAVLGTNAPNLLLLELMAFHMANVNLNAQALC
jgi:hypothetical protein